MARPGMFRFLMTICLLALPGGRGARAAAERPNVVVILADDLGYSDLGCYGGEIRTPNLDGLAAGGLRFTQFYNTARCWPSRAAILTGYYAQQVRRDKVPGVPSGNKGTRPAWAKLLPERLKPLGYRSYHSGKWHVDGTPLPTASTTPTTCRTKGDISARARTRRRQEAPPVGPKAEYYATTAIADRGIKYLDEHAERYADKPFFLYLAFTSPHFPLHAKTGGHRPVSRTYRGWEEVPREAMGENQGLRLVGGRLSRSSEGSGRPITSRMPCGRSAPARSTGPSRGAS
ncbi:MAG: sulfatase-like hydrolase/transferase [Singulisphaera sp.]